MAERDTGRGLSTQRNRQLGNLRYLSKTSVEKRTAVQSRKEDKRPKSKSASEGPSPDKSDASAKSSPVDRVRKLLQRQLGAGASSAKLPRRAYGRVKGRSRGRAANATRGPLKGANTNAGSNAAASPREVLLQRKIALLEMALQTERDRSAQLEESKKWANKAVAEPRASSR